MRTRSVIVREWRGRAERRQSGDYPAHFRLRVLPELRRIPGFLGAELLRRDIGDAIEFTVLTRWSSMIAIRAFAGDDPKAAKVEIEAAKALRDFDGRVIHHDVIETTAAALP